MTNEAACYFGTEMKEKQRCWGETCHNFIQLNNAQEICLVRNKSFSNLAELNTVHLSKCKGLLMWGLSMSCKVFGWVTGLSQQSPFLLNYLDLRLYTDQLCPGANHQGSCFYWLVVTWVSVVFNLSHNDSWFSCLLGFCWEHLVVVSNIYKSCLLKFGKI